MSDKSDDRGEKTLGDSALRVLENLAELEPQLVNAGIFGEGREPVVLNGESEEWPRQAEKLLTALDTASGEEELDSAQIASAEGEVFAVREAGLSLVAVTGRFVLASLTSYDMRMALRDVIRAEAVAEPANPMPGAENGGSRDA